MVRGDEIEHLQEKKHGKPHQTEHLYGNMNHCVISYYLRGDTLLSSFPKSINMYMALETWGLRHVIDNYSGANSFVLRQDQSFASLPHCGLKSTLELVTIVQGANMVCLKSTTLVEIEAQ